MMGSFFLFYFILALFGTYLIYTEIRSDGCDPSGVIGSNECRNSAPKVFGAMLGIAFAAQGISQVGNFTEILAHTRVATYEALLAINRKPGSKEEIIYYSEDDDDLSSSTHSKKSKSETDWTASGVNTTAHSNKQTPQDLESGEINDDVKAILPKFEIVSSSREGLQPEISGAISVKDVFFSYPTRPHNPVLKGMSVEIKAGQTVAFVGPSGGGKSTIVSLLERFYDPSSGSVFIDGVDVRDINVTHLRRNIGYVGQEPALFATSIRGNIKYGNPDATQEQIEEAARLANAHDFITKFSDGYDTQVGDKGSQLSGGQKQRIAIARVLVGNPRILLLDEATSALDNESELVVQDALDKIVAKKRITTIIIAHRLSTIRNADTINVIVNGRVAEQGTHNELMAKKSYYRKLVEKQEGHHEEPASAPVSRKPSTIETYESSDVLKDMKANDDSIPHLEFRNVRFSYPSRPKKKIFEKFNLIIHQGQTIALVGPSGGGKSTTVGLIERFYDPNEGEILYHGTDLKALNVNWYRSQLSYVGQEPVLFNMTIAENISFGYHEVSRADIEEAARQANAHDFIVQLPDGYETLIGARGIQLSGGQKQRVAIARALVRKPRVLILDEATSALDNESESIVQEAINRLMSSKDLTVIVIAHRLSTIRNADKIALIAEGKVVEYGSHDDLIEKPNGRYKRLFDSSKRQSTIESMGLKKDEKKNSTEKEEDEEIDWEAKMKAEEANSFSLNRARQMAAPDVGYMFFGSIGALIAGGVFPMMGVLFSQTIGLLFQIVLPCPGPEGTIPLNFTDCTAYHDSIANEMRHRSFRVGGYWICVLAAAIFGNMLTFWGFGTASERLNKRVRDSTFSALLRQEVGFFDKRSVGSITSELQDDAAKIHAFSGEPARSFLIAVASLVTGLVLSFVYMWQFALLAIGVVPFMAFASAIHMKRMLGADEGNLDASNDGLNTPGGVIVETLLNIRTVSALTLERRRFQDYRAALHKSEPNYKFDAFMTGCTSGLSLFIQQWVNGLLIWFGSWLLFHFPEHYSFNNFLIANFSILFCLMGLGTAFQDMSDRSEVEESAGRIFYLLDRKSEIDPLSDEGKKLK
jgi:ATP-binding cassette subfamily B (MDR/TAP) protein 1